MLYYNLKKNPFLHYKLPMQGKIGPKAEIMAKCQNNLQCAIPIICQMLNLTNGMEGNVNSHKFFYKNQC